MNRHDRRSAQAGAEKTLPPGYSAACAQLDRYVGAVCELEEPPLFALPPKAIALVGDLGDVGRRLARNAPALALVDFVATLSGKDRPTVMMLQAVLEERGIAIERCTLTELGLQVGGMS